MTIVRSIPAIRAIGISIAGAIASAASAQLVATADHRTATVSARAGASNNSSAATPSSPFAAFDTPVPFVATASLGQAHVASAAAQSSTISADQLLATGYASASGDTTNSDTGSSQAASSFFVAFDLPRHTRLDLSATLGAGQISRGRLVFQGASGQVSYFLDADSPQPVSIARVLPPGSYTIVAYAGAAISLYPSASLTDESSYSLDAKFTELCPADFNHDGFVDGFDYDDFVTCFEGACPPSSDADFNHDGFVDGFDYDDFISAFETACE